MSEGLQKRIDAGVVTSRFYRDRDEEELLGLLLASFRRWPRPEIAVQPIEYLRWKLRSHDQALAHQIIGELNSKMVAARLQFVQRIKVGERVLLSRQSLDQAVLPEFRESGVMSALKSMLRPEIMTSYDINFFFLSGHPGMQGLVAKQFYANESFGDETDVFVSDLDGRQHQTQAVPWSIVHPWQFDERIDDFWRQAASAWDFIVVRDRTYLNWRYDPRAGRFRISVAERDGRIIGYAVASTSYGRGFIADLLTVPDQPDAVDSLISDMLAFFHEARVSRVECWVQRRHPYRDALRRRGFRKQRAMEFRYQPMLASGAELTFLQAPDVRMHVTLADTDLV